MALSKALTSSASDRWNTPADLLAEVQAFLGAYHDPCPALPALPDPSDGAVVTLVDGLRTRWGFGPVYVNPPYGRAIGTWVEKWVHEPFCEGLLLVPARTDTAWFAPLWQLTICFIRGRLHFSGHKDSAPFPSALVYRGPRPASFADAFAHRGPVTRAMWKVAAA